MTKKEYQKMAGLFIERLEISVEQEIPQAWGKLQFNHDLLGGKIRIGGKEYETGFGGHSPSRIRVVTAEPVKTFTGICGYAQNEATEGWKNEKKTLIFTVEANGKKLFESRPLAFGDSRKVNVKFPAETHEFYLCSKAVDGDGRGHLAWGDPMIELAGGKKLSPVIPGESLSLDFPVTFRYGKQSSAEFYRRNPITMAEIRKGDLLTRVFTSENAEIRMKVVMTLHRDLPVLEWHTEFENVSKKRSKNISCVRVLSISKQMAVSSNTDLIRHRGAFNTPNPDRSFSDQFTETYDEVRTNCATPCEIALSCGEGGRPTEDWLPSFDLTDGKETIRAVVGWAGYWTGKFVNNALNAHIELGLGDFDSYLDPGEKVSMPSAYLLLTEGGSEKATNIWRRFLRKYIMGSPKPEVFNGHWGGMSDKEQMQALKMLEKSEFPVDTYWIDAGWYAPHSNDEFEPTWGAYTGDWDFDKKNYPNELADLSKRLHAKGRKLLLWFEPERVVRTCRIAKAHPEYFIDINDNNLLLDLGNPEAWKWCRNKIAGIIKRNKIDWFREDFNFSPRPYWLKKDKSGRKGMTEVRFVEGFYRFWKDLKETFPGLMIDNCASGGRRLDVESLRYSVPLWYSDMHCGGRYDADYALVEHAGMATYCSTFGSGTGLPGNTYQFRASFAPCISFNFCYNTAAVKAGLDPKMVKWRQARLNEYLKVRDTLTGDFYQISLAKPHSGGIWTVFQYNLPEDGRGSVLVFRQKESPVSEIELKLRGLDPKAEYRFSDADHLFKPFTATGAELMKTGFRMRMEKSGSSDIICYQKIK